MTGTEDTAKTENRCLRCGRKIKAGSYGPKCAAKVRAAAKDADLTPWTPAQVAEARQAIEDGAVVPSSREGVFHVVSVDGTEVHLVHRDGCNCTSGLKTHQPRPCWHRCAVAIVLASPAPAAPAAIAPVALPPSADIWAQLDALGATAGIPLFA